MPWDSGAPASHSLSCSTGTSEPPDKMRRPFGNRHFLVLWVTFSGIFGISAFVFTLVTAVWQNLGCSISGCCTRVLGRRKEAGVESVWGKHRLLMNPCLLLLLHWPDPRIPRFEGVWGSKNTELSNLTKAFHFFWSWENLKPREKLHVQYKTFPLNCCEEIASWCPNTLEILMFSFLFPTNEDILPHIANGEGLQETDVGILPPFNPQVPSVVCRMSQASPL